MGEKAALTIKEFCATHGISASAFYEMKREGLGPREMRIGRAGVRISQEAAAAWRTEMEARAAAEIGADRAAA
jgi:predicted DNA-binding transcriptional regulator AlpA